MQDSPEAQATKVAIQNPVEAVMALRISVHTPRHTVENCFMDAYIKVNAGNALNEITKSNVASAVNDWFMDRSIPFWLARACVIANSET